MKSLSVLLIAFCLPFAKAEEKIKMYYNNEDLTKIIELYSKASGQKFILDPSVRGKVSIFIPEPVSIDEAFNQLSSALAVNGFGISKQGDTMIVKSARNIQRDLIEVSSAKPSITPERMYIWIYTPQNISAGSITKDLRILTSKDGELSVNENTNQLIICDWVSNIIRISEILKEVDKKVDPSIAKIIENSKKERELRTKESSTKRAEKTEN